MSVRWIVPFAACAAALVAATPAAAFTPLWSQPVNGAARLVAGRTATVVWAADANGKAALVARPYDAGGRPQGEAPVALVDGISGLTDWLAAPAPGGDVHLVWKAAGVTYAARATTAGSTVYGPSVVSSDEAVAAARGAGATAAPVTLVPDGTGGVYVVLRATPSQDGGDTFLSHVSLLGDVTPAAPGLALTGGTVAAAAADDQGHLVVLLGGPGRSGVAAQRLGPDLASDWPAPIPPYNPLAGPPPAVTQIPLDLFADRTATIAWREAGLVKLQRYTQSGDRLWLRPAGVDGGADAVVVADGIGGAYVASASGDGLRVRRVALDGSLPADSPGGDVHLGLGEPLVEAAAADASGDLMVAYGDGAPPAAAGGVAQMTPLGAWTAPVPGSETGRVTALQGDGSGGAYALGAGDGARLWRLGEAGAALTLRPRAAGVTYGGGVSLAGYLTVEGAPLAGAAVKLAPSAGDPTTVVTDVSGLYRATLRPQANASWTASASGPSGQTIVSDPAIVITVAPDVSLDLRHRRAGDGYVEVFSGRVKPGHAGGRVLVQRRSGDAWRTLVAGTLDASSRYRATWRVPMRTATYFIRALLPAHADHVAGVSTTARLRVVVTRTSERTRATATARAAR